MKNIRVKKLPKGQIIPLKQDYIFSGIFNDEKNIDIVELFISQYFNIPINDVKGNVKIKNRDLPINNKTEHNKQVDLLVNCTGQLINVEINNHYISKGVIERNIVFACHAHGTQLKYGDNDYSDIKKTIQINFNKSNTNSKKSRAKYLLIDNDNNGEIDILSTNIEIDMIDIEKESKLWYSGTSRDAISMWCSLLNASTEAEIATIMESEIMEKVSEETKNKLVDEINKYSEDEEFIGLYNISSKEECAWNSALREAKEEAAKEGRKEDAINLYNNGVSIEIICK